MDKVKKRRIFFVALAVVILLIFFARDRLTRGAILIHAEAPYTVEILGSGDFTCNLDPCEIKQPNGLADLLIQKNGHRSLFTTVDVKIWSTTDIYPKILPIPKLLTATALPEGTSQIKYRLVPDQINGMQKLIRADDSNQLPIIYFPSPLDSYKILPSTNFVLIIHGDSLYKIDVRSKTREKISIELPKIKDAKWSLNGNYLIFTDEQSNKIHLLDLRKSAVSELAFTSSIDQAAWIADEQLIFVTDQDMRNEGVKNGYAESIALVESKTDKYTFGTYHPEADVYTKIESFDEIKSRPTELTPTLNGNELYFKSGENIFKIFLEKF